MSGSCSTPTATAAGAVFYNGYRAGEDIVGPMDYRDGGAVERGEHVGALQLSIENMAAHGMQGRGVMIDLEHHFGRGEKFVGYDELMRIMEADKVVVEAGDIVCFRTGFDRVILGMNKKPDPRCSHANPVRRRSTAATSGCCTGSPNRGVVALIADNYAVEAIAVAALRGRGPLRLIAAARALPVQARRPSRRDLAALRARRLAARARPLALPADRAAAAPARRRRLPGQRRSRRSRKRRLSRAGRRRQQVLLAAELHAWIEAPPR